RAGVEVDRAIHRYEPAGTFPFSPEASHAPQPHRLIAKPRNDLELAAERLHVLLQRREEVVPSLKPGDSSLCVVSTAAAMSTWFFPTISRISRTLISSSSRSTRRGLRPPARA